MSHHHLLGRVLFILCCMFVFFLHTCLFSLVFVGFFFFFKWASANTHTATETDTHTHIHRQRLIPPAAHGEDWHAPFLPHASWYLWMFWMSRPWNESYLIWETHLVPSFLFLSSNHPPLVAPAPPPQFSCPAKPTALPAQRPALSLQSNPRSCECAKDLQQKMKNMLGVCSGVACSLLLS